MSDREYIVSMYCADRGVKCEEIVRCKDCENYAKDDMGDWCTLHDFAERGSMALGYCAWACRKEVDA